MTKTIKHTKKTYTTLKVFLVCFAVYFICNVYSK